MPTAVRQPALTSLKDLTRLIQNAEGFHPLVAALQNGHGGVVDGAWGSSGALATAALGLHAPRSVLVVLAHPRDVDGWVEDLASFAGAAPAVFPAWDNLPTAESTVVDETTGQRLRVLRQLDGGEPPRFVITTFQALTQPVPDRERLAQGRRVVRVGEQLDLNELAGWLVAHGFQPSDAIEFPGEFSRRGGILDVFPPDAEHPYRLEFFGDDVESVRTFSLQTQRSVETLDAADLLAANIESAADAHGLQPVGVGDATPLTGHFCEYLPPNAWTVLVAPDDLREQGKHYLERQVDPRGLFSVEGVFQQLLRFPNVTVSELPTPSVEATLHLRVESVERFSGDLARLGDELASAAAGEAVLIACHNDAERKRLTEVLAAGALAQAERLHLVTGRVRAGFRILVNGEIGPRRPIGPISPLRHQGIVVLSDHELFHREGGQRVLPRRRLEARAIDSFLDLSEGDYVVHVSHGIGRYQGMQVLDKNGLAEEHLVLEFREGTRLFVPASKIELVQKYVGGAKTEPELAKLGGTAWLRKKERAEAAVMDLAADMIELQALRESRAGTAYPTDTEWQAEFEGSFPYQETPDQLTALAEIKRDLEKARPMDRLVCGDVGYGKTEVALRAAFKAMDNGRQVAVLVPTTVLAEQHGRTFGDRLAEYPFVVECLSRFRSGAEQRAIIKRLATGGVDVIVGTHRLLSADVQFKDLGLVIIDEEQRFGVEHKERLKRLRQTVDVLTLTATPIPRTLHLSLLGIRDISNLETPPPNRLAIETRIARFDPDLIRHAVLRELNRDGQIYFVHNRVYNIQEIADKLKRSVPEARITVGHGQMDEHELERAMTAFVRREFDILVATTIIESGLDIPNANTIFINQADNYGLADLHQLRGRVGRYKHRAYCYLLLDGERGVTPSAVKRLKAIEEFTELGAGFKIAMRDLEIRGAGNILGTEQSGHIAAVGYELYCQLLENAVRRMKNQTPRTAIEATVELPWPAFLPRPYVTGQRLRIEVYRRLARLRKLERIEEFRQELRDRFGPIPEPVEWVLRLAELRLLASKWHVVSIHLEKPPEGTVGPTDVVLRYRNPRAVQKLAARSGGRLRVVDAASAYHRLRAVEEPPEALYACLKHLLRWPA